MKEPNFWKEVYPILSRYQTAQVKILELKARYQNGIPAIVLAQIQLLKEGMDADEAEMRALIPNFDNQ